MIVLLWNILLVRAIVIITILGCGVYGLYYFGTFPTPRRYRFLQKIPGPEGVMFLGFGLELMRIPADDILVWLEKKFKNYDRIMKLWIMGMGMVYMKEPRDIQVLFSNIDYITKGLEYFILKPWLKEGLLTSTGNKWHSRRKMLTPAFHFKILDDNMNILNKNAKILCDKFEEIQGEEVTLDNLITLCTLDIIMGTAMGVNVNAQSAGGQEYVNTLKKLSEINTYRLMSPHIYTDIMFYLSSSGREFRKAVRYLHKFTRNVIEEKKLKKMSSNENASELSSSSRKVLRAFLDMILEYENNNPGSFSNSGIQEEVDTFMFEGHDTTSSALIFIFYNLAIHQEIQDKVHEELFEIFGNSDRDATANDLHRMLYLEMVIKESLRLHPSVPAISRLLQKDLILDDGMTVPAGSNIIIPIYLIHRNKNYWPDPNKFDPERFSEDKIQGRHPYAYIPFSAGPRNCIGQKFAMMELKTVVSAVIRKLKVLPMTKQELKLVVLLVLRSVVPIKCKFVKR